MNSVKRVVAALCVTAGLIVLTPTVASAHEVGVPGTPTCFGERISHGSSDHGWPPPVRAQRLEDFVYKSGALPAEEVEAFTETFGVVDQHVTVRIFAEFVRVNCSDDPFVPPED